MNAQKIANQIANNILGQIQPAGTFVLTLYEDAETYNLIRGNQEWPFKLHCEIMLCLTSILKSKGIQVKQVVIKLNDFYDFLARYDLPNNNESRAQFAAWITSPDPKPTPKK